MKQSFCLLIAAVFLTACQFVTTPTTDPPPAVANTGAILKSGVLYDNTLVMLSFDRQIAAGQGTHIAHDIIVSQTIGTTTTTWNNQEFVCNVNQNSSIVSLVLIDGTFSLTDPIVIRTVTDENILTIDTDGKKISSNTVGLYNAAFAAISLQEGLAASSTAVSGLVVISGSESNFFTVGFNKNIDKNSIASNWNALDSTNFAVEKTAYFDGTSKKFSVDGVGNFQFSNLSVGSNGSGLTSCTVIVKIDTVNNKIYLSFKTVPSLSVSFGAASIVRFTPIDTLKSSINTSPDANFKPEVVMN